MANGGAAHDGNLSPSAGVGVSLAGAPVATPANIQLQPGETVRIDRITGNKIIEGGPRRSAFKPLPKPPLHLIRGIDGLSAYISDLAYNFTWIRSEPIDEADARDAQCRAGYPDTGYGFFGLNVTTTFDGLFRATWCSWKSTE